jgi:hypothetical protein
MKKINVKELRKQQSILDFKAFVKIWAVILLALIIVSIIENL